jgi:hypothetical protein
LSLDAGRYLCGRRVSSAVSRAYRAILQCQTEALGFHVARCENGHVAGVFHNSCRHRFCPRCGWGLGRKWLARQSRMLLGCAHHHLIFTIPHEFNALWMRNQRAIADALFKSARGAIWALAGDARYLGSQPGVIGALHTWGQQLGVHLHVHCLVTAGGVDKDGCWVASRRKWFLPEEPLMRLFRGKFIYAMRGLARSGELRLPEGWVVKDVERLCEGARRRHWNIDVRERYDSPTHVLNYLGRYLNGGPLNESRLLSVSEDVVEFRYRDYRETNPFGVAQVKERRMSREQFIQRLLQHVPPKGLHMVRGYGVYAAGGMTKQQREKLREALPLSFEVRVVLRPRHPEGSVASWPQECATCGAPLHLVYFGRGAPRVAA